MTEVANEETDHECAVCLEALTDAGARILTVCGHTFCEACITRIAKDAGMHSRCPLCRQQYVPANIMSLQQLAAKDKEAAKAGEDVPATAAADEQAPAAPPKVRHRTRLSRVDCREFLSCSLDGTELGATEGDALGACCGDMLGGTEGDSLGAFVGA